jgi:hypothetical protein
MKVKAHPMPFDQPEYNRTIIERFQTEGPENWHFETTVFQATNEQEREWINRSILPCFQQWRAGDLNLMTLNVRAYVDPVWLGTASSVVLMIDGLTFTGGKIYGTSVPALDSWDFSHVCHQARYAGLDQLEKLNELLKAS